MSLKGSDVADKEPTWRHVTDSNTIPAAGQKTNSRGIVLVPQPSDSPRDPLNWSTRKKLMSLGIVCLASFAGVNQALSNASGFLVQAKLYGVTPTEMSYSLSAALAGLATGPLIWTPFAAKLGGCGMIFWSAILTLAMNIWSACMTDASDYNTFIVSRLFGGLFGSAPTTVGANIIMQTFFLHDRGKCITVYSCCILFGTIFSTTISGYIVQRVSWTVQFWYNVGILGLVAVLCFLFLDDTTWSRENDSTSSEPPIGFLQRKAITFVFPHRRPARGDNRSIWSRWGLILRIFLSPAALVIGLVLMTTFSWSVAVSTFLSIFLQEPVEEGGYGFSPDRNAAFSFVLWVAALAAQVYGFFVGDRLPLAICSRNNGVWKPEYRLHCLWIPMLLVFPIGLGIFGAALEFHWHFMVLAVGTFLIVFSAVSCVSPCVNYIIEAFTPAFANEATAVMNFWRLIFGIALTFFLFPWANSVGYNWVFGTMAFLTIFAFLAIFAVMRFGPRLRDMNLLRAKSEAGLHVIEDDGGSADGDDRA